MDAVEALLITGELPDEVHPMARLSRGLYFKSPSRTVADMPLYIKQPLPHGQTYAMDSGVEMAMWYNPWQLESDDSGPMAAREFGSNWSIGKISDSGKGKLANVSMAVPVRDASVVVENFAKNWFAADPQDTSWVAAPHLKVYAVTAAGADTSNCIITGERTVEQRNAEGRKRAIDLDGPETRKLARSCLETRVAEARSLRTAAVDAKYKSLLQPAMDAWADDKIDDDELHRRKKEARNSAEQNDSLLNKLNSAYSGFNTAIDTTKTTLAAARSAEAQAAAAEDAAEAVLEAAILAIMPAASSHASSSGA